MTAGDRQQDLAAFLSACVVADEGKRVRLFPDLYDAHLRWCAALGTSPITRDAFGPAVRLAGIRLTGCRLDNVPEPRAPLPDRRSQVSRDVKVGGQRLVVSVGFDDEGRAREVFLRGFKIGSTMDALLDDAVVHMSLLLQAGYRAAELAKHLGREGVEPDAQVASPLGLVARVAAEIEESVAASEA